VRKLLQVVVVLGYLVSTGMGAGAGEVIRDGGIGMSRAELEYIVRNWTPEMQAAAARDVGDRLELLNMALASKKIAAEAEKLSPEKDGDLYWKSVMMVRATLRTLVVDTYLRDAKVPDMSALAQEHYLTRKEQFAKMPEQRLSSHILLKCPAQDDCDQPAVKARAEELLLELEEGGSSFEELARAHSQDLRTGAQGGRYDRWLARGNKQVAPEYIEAVFKLSEVGDHTGVTRTRFGYHLIRLDEIKPEHYRSFEESKADIVADLEEQYRELNARAFDARFRISDDAYIDGAAMEEIFAPYKPGAAVDNPSSAAASPGHGDSPTP
jgi:parvulin-like peptidyl-prolyl isomerase